MNTTDSFDATSIFSSVNRHVTAQDLQNGSALTIFGDVTVDLTHAAVTEIPATISVTAVFGSINLILPEDWKMEDQILQIFGSVHDRRSSQLKMKVDQAPAVVFTGVCVFGSVEITTAHG